MICVPVDKRAADNIFSSPRSLSASDVGKTQFMPLLCLVTIPLFLLVNMVHGLCSGERWNSEGLNWARAVELEELGA